MKKLCFIILAFGISSCAIPEHMSRQCSGSLKDLCSAIFGHNQEAIDSAQNQSIAELEHQINLNYMTLNNMINMADESLQSQIAVLQLQTAQLIANQTVVGFKDVCGDKSGIIDEIMFKLADGRYVAYFESGGDRRLSVLPAGNYRTTDGSNCYFTVNSSNQITNEHY